MTNWHSAKEVPNPEEWLLTKWYDREDGEFKYETDYLFSSENWKDYAKRNSIMEWYYIKDAK